MISAIYVVIMFHNPAWGLRSSDNSMDYQGFKVFFAYQEAMSFVREQHAGGEGEWVKSQRMVDGERVTRLDYGNSYEYEIHRRGMIND
jgi:hypothetical protein